MKYSSGLSENIWAVNEKHVWNKFIFEKEDDDGYNYYKIYFKCKECGLVAHYNVGSDSPFLHEYETEDLISCNEIIIRNIIK